MEERNLTLDVLLRLTGLCLLTVWILLLIGLIVRKYRREYQEILEGIAFNLWKVSCVLYVMVIIVYVWWRLM